MKSACFMSPKKAFSLSCLVFVETTTTALGDRETSAVNILTNGSRVSVLYVHSLTMMRSFFRVWRDSGRGTSQSRGSKRMLEEMAGLVRAMLALTDGLGLPPL